VPVVSLDFKVESKGWSWKLEPSWVITVYEGTTRVAVIPGPFLMELVSARLRDAGLMRRLAALLEDDHLDLITRDLEPPPLPEHEPMLPPIVEPFGAPLRRMRETAGVTRAGLAAIADCTPDHIAALELGMSLPSPELADKLAAHFGVRPATLWPGVVLQRRYKRPRATPAEQETRRAARRARSKSATSKGAPA
jgi:DNA-binding XRE family transcriptional regulator